MCHMFINSKIGDFDFGKERIIDIHPKLKSARGLKRKERNQMIDLYIDEYYKKNRKDIETSKEGIYKIWKEIEVEYFKEVEKLFNNKIYLKSKNFTSFLSIFTCSPIIEPQGWQIYYKIKNKSEIKRLFAHEILHFYYYGYIKNDKIVKKYYKNMNEEEYWTKAEIFNVIILNQKQFQNIIGKKEEGYDMHKKYFKEYLYAWNKSKNVNDFLVRINEDELYKQS